MPTADMAEITSRPTFTSATKIFAAKGITAKAESAGDGGNARGEPEDGLVRAFGNDVFLEEQLQGIGNGLQETVRADAHGAQADLEIRKHLALHQHDVAGDQRKTPR